MGLVASSLFLEDWELAKVALSCRCHGTSAVLTVDGLRPRKARDVVREMKEKERERRTLLRHVGWSASIESFEVRHGVPVERGVPSFLGATCGVHRSERIFNALI